MDRALIREPVLANRARLHPMPGVRTGMQSVLCEVGMCIKECDFYPAKRMCMNECALDLYYG